MIRTFDIEKVRQDFPIFAQRIRGRPPVYLDSAATSQKPRSVIETLVRYYEEYNANIHRGIHHLSERATAAYEEARVKVQRFIQASSSREILFVRGTTEAINLVAQSFLRPRLGAGDEILITTLEHHSNIVPWQILCEEKGARLQVVPITDQGELIFEEYEKMLNPRVKLVAVAHASNALGTVNPVREMILSAHKRGIPVLVDGAQAAPHLPINVIHLDCDFYAFSGHKMYGPTGVGVLYGKEKHLRAMPPYQAGGDMISSVTFEKTLYNELPYKFEAGTPNIAGVIGLGAAIDYLSQFEPRELASYEAELLRYGANRLSEFSGLQLIGTASQRIAVLNFVMEGIHPHDIGTVLDQEGIAIRTGHHCAMPLMQRFGVPATARASLGLYNTKEDIDSLIQGLRKVREVFHL